MITNRLIFIGTWLMLTIALLVFPGFEVRGLAWGMIIGYGPALLSNRIYESQHAHPTVFISMMIIFSGITVSFFSWLMDKSRTSKKIFPFLYCTMVLFAGYFAFSGIDYEEWQRTPAIAAAMESPEVNYEPTRWDYWDLIMVPKLLAGGLIGLYVVSVFGTLLALLKRSRKTKIPDRATSSDVLPHAADL